jgi:type I restriction-modification system DNA methylase subunit
MDKKQLSERDICTKYITPALERSGWDILTQIREEFSLTDGRILLRGKLHTRAKNKRADYVLHLFNDIYEKILADLQSAGNVGEYYKPRAVTQFMVDIIDPKLGEKLLDPACGTGGFLPNTIEHLKPFLKTADDRITLQANLNGVEKKPLPHMLAMTNVMLHGIIEIHLTGF